jgi:D-3-phosphoglycerate dehydrogenase
MLPLCDVVSMHAAVTPETQGLMSAERFGAMREGAVYVNSARAGLHDLDALTKSLASGHLAAAALDHFEGENLPTDHPLVGMANVILTPHIGGATYDTEANHTTLIADGLAALLRGEAPSNLVNPEVLSHG